MDPRIAKAREIESREKTARALADIVPRLDKIEGSLAAALGPSSAAAGEVARLLDDVERQLAELIDLLKRHLPEIVTAGTGRKERK